MSHQPSFDFTNRAPIAATKDPESSRIAAREYTESGKRSSDKAKLLTWMRANRRFMNSREIAEAGGFDRHLVGRRLSDIERDGFVKRGPICQCQITRKQAITWIATKESE